MCTGVRFTDAAGKLVFGRNLDWSAGYGERVLTIPRNYSRTWRHTQGDATGPAIIGMGIVSDNVPLFFDCANEHGLAVAGLNFPGWAEYEKAPVANKTNICAFEFPFWLVSTCKTVDEAEAALKDVAILAEAPAPNLGVSLLHWIIGDKTRAIVVEYTQDGMHIYHDDLNVLTNQPAFPWHAEHVRDYINVTPEVPANVTWGTQELSAFGSGFGMHGFPGDFSSPSRFVRVAYLNSHYPTCSTNEENVARLFHTLQGAAMVKGGAKMQNGDFEYTVYTGGYVDAEQAYYYNTYDNLQIKRVAMSDSDLEGTEIIQAS